LGVKGIDSKGEPNQLVPSNKNLPAALFLASFSASVNLDRGKNSFALPVLTRNCINANLSLSLPT